MTTIQRDGQYATFINYFTVEPDKARPLADMLSAATAEVMCHIPGFISANIHLSTDHTRVVNYAQWATVEAFQAMLENPDAREHMSKCGELATSFEPRIYTVESVHPNPSAKR
jgi:heme-degrading monooxygenase HmoA